MKTFVHFMLCLAVGWCLPMFGQKNVDCDIHLVALSHQNNKTLSEGTEQMLLSRLCQAISVSDVYADEDYSQFFVAAKVLPLYKNTMAGSPERTVVSLELTCYIGDLEGKKVFSTQTLELKGVGTSEQRAYINAMRTLNAKNTKIAEFVKKGKKEIIDYYNRNFDNIVAQAKQKALQKEDEAALMFVGSIPVCCNRYDEASRLLLDFYQKYIDNEGKRLLIEAQTAWMAQPDGDGAVIVAQCLGLMDPDCSSWKEAMKLYDEVKSKIKDDWNFEMRQKYTDAISIEKQKIDAARQVGVAYGNGQKEQTTNLMWLK